MVDIPYGRDYPDAPWIDRDGQPIDDGAQLLDDVHGFASRFLAFPTKHHLIVLVLWVVHTWAVNAFYVTPRLVLDSPEPGCGKTRVLEVLVLLCRKAKLTLSTTTAALYRRIAAAGNAPPTIMQDEADAIFGKTSNPQAEDLRALYNAGYKRGATVDRCEGDAKNMRVVEFPSSHPWHWQAWQGKCRPPSATAPSSCTSAAAHPTKLSMSSESGTLPMTLRRSVRS